MDLPLGRIVVSSPVWYSDCVFRRFYLASSTVALCRVLSYYPSSDLSWELSNNRL